MSDPTACKYDRGASFWGAVKDKWFGFYGVDAGRFKLDAKVYEAVENEDDGYRSYLDTVERVNSPDVIFFKTPLAQVRVVDDPPTSEQYYDFDGFALVGRDGHVWLRFGTYNASDYYPGFVFAYYPKEPA